MLGSVLLPGGGLLFLLDVLCAMRALNRLEGPPPQPYFAGMQKFLIVLGVVLLALGLAWPWLKRLGLGRLPGDLHWGGEGWSVHVLLGTSLIVSVVLTLLLNLIWWWLNR